MNRVLVVILSVALAGVALGEDKPLKREPLKGKRGLAPIRGRRLGPTRVEPPETHENAADRTVEQRERSDRRRGRSGTGALNGLDVLDFDDD